MDVEGKKRVVGVSLVVGTGGSERVVPLSVEDSVDEALGVGLELFGQLKEGPSVLAVVHVLVQIEGYFIAHLIQTRNSLHPANSLLVRVLRLGSRTEGGFCHSKHDVLLSPLSSVLVAEHDVVGANSVWNAFDGASVQCSEAVG